MFSPIRAFSSRRQLPQSLINWNPKFPECLYKNREGFFHHIPVQSEMLPLGTATKRAKNAATWNSHKKGKTLWHWRKASDVCPTLTWTILFNISAYITLSLHSTKLLVFCYFIFNCKCKCDCQDNSICWSQITPPFFMHNKHKQNLLGRCPTTKLSSTIATLYWSWAVLQSGWHINSYLMATHQIYWYM